MTPRKGVKREVGFSYDFFHWESSILITGIVNLKQKMGMGLVFGFWDLGKIWAEK